jgi:hypothetical protein
VALKRSPEHVGSFPLRVVIDGEEVAKLEWEENQSSSPTDGNQRAALNRVLDEYERTKVKIGNNAWRYPKPVAADNPHVQLQLLTPDGWINQPYGIHADHGKHEFQLDLHEVKTMQVLYDNRGGAKAEVAFGKLKMILPADKASKLFLPVPRSDDNAGVKLNGKPIGSVTAGKEGTYLIDTSGKRAYSQGQVAYGDAVRNLRFGPPPPRYWNGKHLYALSGERRMKIDYFLKNPPTRIKTIGIMGFRNYLVDASQRP